MVAGMNDQLTVRLATNLSGGVYRQFVKPLLFNFDADSVHERITEFGERIGSFNLGREVISKALNYQDPNLQQKIFGMEFKSPLGLAAGFDYEAKLTQILPSLGFGFETVGTITNHAYEGNPKPRLGRLPKSQSLMVSKGFKNPGAQKTMEKLSNLNFDFPVGISIGRTNSLNLQTQSQSVKDILTAFELFERSSVRNSYYELNISCPNLMGNISFYPPKNLEQLLKELDLMRVRKPIMVKMPIEKSEEEVFSMLKVIVKHRVAGVIFGNLQKDRTNPSLEPEELARFPKGNFSGKPTFQRSNELISSSFKLFGKSMVIWGCGGVFNAADAWEKIIRGASLVQLITGLVFNGPQLVSEINRGLVGILRKKGLKNVSEAVGLGENWSGVV